MKHLKLWIWLKTNGLQQKNLADGLEKSVSWVSRRMIHQGFSGSEMVEVLQWARKARPSAKVTPDDLFDKVAA